MKKQKAAMIALAMAIPLVLSGCSLSAASGSGSLERTPIVGANEMGPWEPAEEQSQQAIKMFGDDSGFAEFNIDETYRSVHIGCDYYKGGRLQASEEVGSIGLHVDPSEKAKALSGLAGYRVTEEGGYAISISADGTMGTIDDAEFKGFEKDNEGISVANISGTVKVKDGKKCYLVAVHQGEHCVDPQTAAAEPELTKENEGAWLIYVMFSTKAGWYGKAAANHDAQADQQECLLCLSKTFTLIGEKSIKEVTSGRSMRSVISTRSPLTVQSRFLSEKTAAASQLC